MKSTEQKGGKRQFRAVDQAGTGCTHDRVNLTEDGDRAELRCHQCGRRWVQE